MQPLDVLIIVGAMFAVVFVFVWTFLPFAIFGTKPILRDIEAHLAAIEKRLKDRQP